MKRRTNPSISRAPLPRNVKFNLEDLCPGIGAMSDLEGFGNLFALSQIMGHQELSSAILDAFTESRGLQICESSDGFKGFSVFLLQRKDSGEIIGSFSSEFR